MDPVRCGNGLDLFNPLGSDGTSSLGEGLEAVFESESHAFEQTSVDYVGEGMAIQNSAKIRLEAQAAGDLSQTSEEYFGVGHSRARRQVFGVARIANDCAGADVAEEEGRRGETRRADHDVGFGGELMWIGRDLNLRRGPLHPIAFQFRSEPAQALWIACAEQHAVDEGR
jgi:hypothetical protein